MEPHAEPSGAGGAALDRPYTFIVLALLILILSPVVLTASGR
jgi:hypothetical protein